MRECLTVMPDLRSTLRVYFDRVNSDRYADVAALFGERAELEAPGTAPRRGRGEIEGYYRAALRPYPQHRDDPTRVVIADRTALVEIHFTGLLASGVPLEFEAVDVFDFDHRGLILRLRSWYDSHAVYSELRRST